MKKIFSFLKKVKKGRKKRKRVPQTVRFHLALCPKSGSFPLRAGNIPLPWYAPKVKGLLHLGYPKKSEETVVSRNLRSIFMLFFIYQVEILRSSSFYDLFVPPDSERAVGCQDQNADTITAPTKIRETPMHFFIPIFSFRNI